MTSQQALMLFLLAVGALGVPLLAGRLGLFAAPCEILYGTLVATFVPAASHLDTFTATLGQFGLLMLLFLAGMEIDFELLRARGPRLLGRAVLTALALQGVCLLVGWWEHWPPVVVLILGAVSISVLLVVLREDGLSQSEFGQTLLIVGAIGEFLTILILTGYDLASRVGMSWALALAALKLLALLLLGYGALRGLNAAIARRPETFARLVNSGDPSEIGVRAALALMLAFAAVAVVLHVEQLLATFIAGAVCGFTFRGRNALTAKLATMGQGFFVPIFFITVGLGLRLGDLLQPQVLAHVLGLLLALFLTRPLVFPVLALAGVKWREAFPGMLLLSAPLTMQVAIAQVGISVGQLDPQTHTVILAAAILGALLFPLLARPFVPQPEAAGQETHSAPALEMLGAQAAGERAIT